MTCTILCPQQWVFGYAQSGKKFKDGIMKLLDFKTPSICEFSCLRGFSTLLYLVIYLFNLIYCFSMKHSWKNTIFLLLALQPNTADLIR